MIDIRQSPNFACFMKDIGWSIKKLKKNYIYLKKFPLIGSFAKMPRVKEKIDLKNLKDFKKNNNIFTLKISPFLEVSQNQSLKYRDNLLKNKIKIENFPFNPTTTIYIDLSCSKEEIFKKFKQAKRRGVRRACKNEVVVKESNDINLFSSIRKKQYFPIGFLVGFEMKKLWENFYPANATLLLAYKDSLPISGLLLLFYDSVAYYWFASSLKIGKKLYAPTLLVWEALKIAKKRDCTIFDFEGIYDERFEKAARSWIGFTRFKQGFGGKEIVFVENFSL